MAIVFSITTPGWRSIVPFRPSPVFGAFLPELSSPKISSASGPLLLQRLFQLLLLQLPLFCCGGFFCRCFLISCCLFSSRFSAAFLSAAAFSAAAFLSAAAFQQPLSSQLLPWLFQQLQLRFLSCFSCSCFCRFRFLLQCAAAASAFFCASAAALAASALLFSSRLQPLSSQLLPQL